jgi:hypothetical protein
MNTNYKLQMKNGNAMQDFTLIIVLVELTSLRYRKDGDV